MTEKKCLFSCYFCSKFNISLIVFPLSFVSIRFLHDTMFFYERPLGSFKIFKFNLPYLFYLFLPKIFSIILFFITKWKIKSEGSLVQANIASKNYHIIKKNEYEKKMIFFILIISLLEVLYYNIESLINYYVMKGKIQWLVEKKTCNIIFVPLFSYFILDKVFYKHHVLGLFLGILGGTLVNAVRFILGFATIDNYPFHVINIFLSSFNSLALVLIKYIMKKYVFLSPYLLLFYDGVCCIIISILLTSLEYFIVTKLPKEDYENEHDLNYFKENFFEIITIFKDQSDRFYILFFLSIIFSFCYFISNIYILFNYSPILVILFELIIPIDSDILDFLIFREEKDHVRTEIFMRSGYQMIGYAFLIFGALMLNEIIVLNFLGFNTNTFLNIAKRSENDSIALLNINNMNDSETESQLYNTEESED